jgi:hypothetical protein
VAEWEVCQELLAQVLPLQVHQLLAPVAQELVLVLELELIHSAAWTQP